MMRIFLQKTFFTILLFQGTFMFAQDAPVKKIASPKDRIVFDLNYDGWLNAPKEIQQKPKSIGFNIALMWDYPVGYGPLSLAFGLGLSSHNVHSNGQVVYPVDTNYTHLTPITTPYTTNKLSVNYVEVPLELRIRAKGGHAFKMAVGGKIGYAYNIHTKVIDGDGKRKIYGIKNVDPLRYGVTFRIGYNKFDIQGFYSLSTLFVKGKGEPDMIPYSIGVGLLLY